MAASRVEKLDYVFNTSGFRNQDVDAFGRLRVSQVQTIFDNQFQYDKNSRFWDESVSGTGVITHLPNESSLQLSTGGTASGAKAATRTRRYFRYQPGKSQLVTMTGTLGTGKANVRSRVGYFDDNNGVFFEQDGTTLRVVRRTKTSGSVVDNQIDQSSWNVDKFDGTGPSGITIDTSKAQIFLIDFQWLGVGKIRFGFDIDGDILVCHEIDNANSLTKVYMTTANLPLSYEIENTGTAASSTNLIQICSSVQSEGGRSEFDSAGRLFSTFNSSDKAINASTTIPILSVRLKSTFNSITNRGSIFPVLVDLLSSTTTAATILLNASLTGASWSSVNSSSIVESDQSATAVTGGIPLSTRFVPSGGNAQSTAGDLPLFRDPLTLSADGTSSDILTIAAISLSGSGQMRSSLTWSELK